MENASVFEFLDYRQYLRRAIQSSPKRGRGMKSALAAAAGCQGAYFSRILADLADLSLEQAEAVSTHLGHSDPETHYFLLIVQYARAGTPRLKAHFKKQLDEVRQKRLVLKERFQVKATLPFEDQATYYSSWIYTAAHMCASVPALANKEAMAEYLGVSVAKISSVLEFLIETGMLAFEKGEYRLGTSRIHLGSDSALISKHHTNWRLQAMRSFDRDDRSMKNEDLHYTSIVSLSVADRNRLKEILVKVIEDFNAVVAPSKEEAVSCLALDFFGV
jgi:uncharacterized protein (TIGR02147 family)